MKKILYITNIPAPYTVVFFNELGKQFNLTVAFERRKSEERDKSWESFKAVNFKYVIINKRKVVSPLRLPLGILKILKESRYDLYIVGNYSTLAGMLTILWLRLNKLPYAIHADGGLVSEDSFLRYHLKKYFLRGANIYFSSGKITTEYFVHYGADRSRIYEYPFSSIKKSQIRTDNDNQYYRKKLDLDADKKIIVSVGQIIPRKGFDILIEAVGRLKSQVQLYIIGGKATEDLIRLVAKLRLNNVKFIPFLPFATILDYMAAADLFVLLTREDIWGLVINEAFSMGAPVISTDRCVAAVEMIEDGKNGYIVEVENPVQAAERMDYLLNNENLCYEIRKNNLQKAQKYTIESMTKEYCKIIDNYLGY